MASERASCQCGPPYCSKRFSWGALVGGLVAVMVEECVRIALTVRVPQMILVPEVRTSMTGSLVKRIVAVGLSPPRIVTSISPRIPASSIGIQGLRV